MRRWLLVVLVVAMVAPTPAHAAGTWTWPVTGPVIRGYDPPDSPYGSGHRGIDIAAPIGTPVHAAGAGKVIVAGQQTGYGNVVMLQHGATYTTVYAHLSRFATGIKQGARVAQGDVIGYVGETGWATGPHLHYEFRVDNVQKNPLTVALPDAQAVPANQRAAYAEGVAPLAEELALSQGIVLAGGE